MNSLWCAIAPINYADPLSKLSVPFEFDKGVVLREVPPWLKKDTFTSYLNATHRHLVLTEVRYAFSSEYEADALGDPDPNWPRKEPRSIQDAYHEAVVLANLALWLAKPSALGFSAIFHADGLPGDPNFRSFQEVRDLKPHMRYEMTCLILEDETLAKKLHAALLTLSREGTVWRSVFSLWQALTEPDWATRYLLLWISLESLFGPEDARELSFRLSQRIGFFLKSDPAEASSLFQRAKTGYAWRSKVVHGLHLSRLDPEDSIRISLDAEILINRSLKKILLDSNLLGLFDSKGREDYLDSLPFQSDTGRFS